MKTLLKDPDQTWEHMITAHRAPMMRIAWSVLRDEHLAQDAVQEAFLVAQERPDQLPDMPEKSARDQQRWLLTVTWRCAKNIQRHDRRRRGLLPVREDVLETDKPPAVMERDETTHIVRQAMATLRPKDREAVRLRFFEERSYEEMAGQLGIGVVAARKRIERALKRLEPAMRRSGLGILLLSQLCWGSPVDAINDPISGEGGDQSDGSHPQKNPHDGTPAGSPWPMLASSGLAIACLAMWSLTIASPTLTSTAHEPSQTAATLTTSHSPDDPAAVLAADEETTPAVLSEQKLFSLTTPRPQPWPSGIQKSEPVPREIFVKNADDLLRPTHAAIIPHDPAGYFTLHEGYLTIEAEVSSLRVDDRFVLKVMYLGEAGDHYLVTVNVGNRIHDPERGLLVSTGYVGPPHVTAENLPMTVTALCLQNLRDGAVPEPFLLGRLSLSWSAEAPPDRELATHVGSP